MFMINILRNRMKKGGPFSFLSADKIVFSYLSRVFKNKFPGSLLYIYYVVKINLRFKALSIIVSKGTRLIHSAICSFNL